jgi:N-acetylneuraminic acid mutarotase
LQVVIRYTYKNIIAEMSGAPDSDSQLSTNIPLLVDPSTGSLFTGSAGIQVVVDGVPSNSTSLSIVDLPANTGTIGVTTQAYLNNLLQQLDAMPTQLTPTLTGSVNTPLNGILSLSAQQLQQLQGQIAIAAAGGQITAPDGSIISQSTIDIIDRLLQSSGTPLGSSSSMRRANRRQSTAAIEDMASPLPDTQTITLNQSTLVAAGSLCKDGDIANDMSDVLTKETIGTCAVSLLGWTAPVAGPVCGFLKLFTPGQLAVGIGNVVCDVAPVNLASIAPNPVSPKTTVNGPSVTEAPTAVFQSTGNAVGQVAETTTDLFLTSLNLNNSVFRYIVGNNIAASVIDDAFQSAFSTLIGNFIDTSVPNVYYYQTNPVPLTMVSLEPSTDSLFTFSGLTMTPGGTAGTNTLDFNTANFRTLDPSGNVTNVSSVVTGNQMSATVLSSVTLSPNQAILVFGGQVQFNASVLGVGPSWGVSWAVDGITGGNSSVGVISSSGLYTAPSTSGTHTITATSLFDGSVGSASANVSAPSSNPVPTISGLNPSSLAAGAAPQTLTISGTGFLSSSTVTFNGISHSAAFISATQLTIPLTSADLATVGTYPVVVTNPAPGGGASVAKNFIVTNGQTANEWTWVSGSNSAEANGVYGTQGVSAASNVPGARSSALSWTDSDGNLWLFGGFNCTLPFCGLAGGNYNDLWEFNLSTQTWTWMSGGNGIDTPGIYGSQGEASPTNVPGARDYANSWTDPSGNLWLFGGDGYDGNNGAGLLNDLWKFNPQNMTWTWVNGSNYAGATGRYGTEGSPAISNFPGARHGSVSWTDTSGHLWLFGGQGFDSTGTVEILNDLWEFDPAIGTWTWMSGSSVGGASGVYGTKGSSAANNIPGGRFYATGWTDPEGNLWLFGGQGLDSAGANGELNDLWEFNLSTNQWEWKSGSSTGSTAGGCGVRSCGQPGVYGSLGTPSSGNVPGGRQQLVGWTDSKGNLWLFGGQGYDSTGTYGDLNDLWEFSPSSNQWTWMGGSNAVNQSGVYGNLGIPASGNIPGARIDAPGWVDKSGTFWLFGGNGNGGDVNDLWSYQP